MPYISPAPLLFNSRKLRLKTVAKTRILQRAGRAVWWPTAVALQKPYELLDDNSTSRGDPEALDQLVQRHSIVASY